jgi:competence protein ComEC
LVQKFTVTGTVHILAVSGENTAMVTGLLFLMLRVCGFGRKGASWAALVGLFFFVFMTGVQPSVCRAGLWGAFILMALILERRPRLGTLVLFSAAILTALNPFVLSDLSFQLSYLAAIGLVVWMPWWVEKTKRLGRFLSMTLSATLGAQMGVWVLMTAMFNQFATYSIPANLAVAPLVGAATAAGLLALLSAWVWAAAGRLFAAAADVPLRLLLWTASWIAGWPGASLVVATPPDTWLVLFHLLLGLTLWVAWPVETPERPSLTWEGVESRRTRARVVLKSLWGLFLVGTLVAWGFASSRPKPFRMTFLSVGHGDAVVAEDPQGRVMVLDGGPKRDGPARWNPVVAYLHHQGHRKVDIVLNSHPDADHVGGLSAVVESFPVGVAYQPLGAQSQSRAYQGFVDALNKRGVPLEPLSRGDRLTLGPEENLEVIHPPQGFHPRKKKDNNRSLGIWVTFPKGEDARTFLLPGDMEKEAWDVWLGTARRPERVDVFLAAHHGRASGQPERVMRALLPREVVVSDSDPHPEIRPLARDGRREVILETAREGAISVEVDASGKMEVSRFKPSKDKEPDEVAISQEEIGTLEP